VLGQEPATARTKPPLLLLRLQGSRAAGSDAVQASVRRHRQLPALYSPGTVIAPLPETRKAEVRIQKEFAPTARSNIAAFQSPPIRRSLFAGDAPAIKSCAPARLGPWVPRATGPGTGETPNTSESHSYAQYLLAAQRTGDSLKPRLSRSAADVCYDLTRVEDRP
jgi:hypothetical protein